MFRYRQWNRVDAMTVAVQQIARRNAQPADIHRLAEINDMSIRVRNAHAARETLETGRFEFRHIANRSIADVSHAVQSARQIRAWISPTNAPIPGTWSAS